MTLKLNEIEKDGHAGVTIELKRDREEATPLEILHQDVISEAIKQAIETIAKHQKMNVLHFDRGTSAEIHDEFFNAVGVETIEQRQARLKRKQQ